jgi:hypothetical protein
MQGKKFIVDGLNICKEKDNQARLSILLSLLLELKKKGHDFECIFDASAYYEFKKQGIGQFYNNIKKECKTHFSQIQGKADPKILAIADHKTLQIISNDDYKEFRQEYSWLKNKDRLVNVSVTSDMILSEMLGIKIKENQDLDTVWNDLKSYLNPSSNPLSPSSEPKPEPEKIIPIPPNNINVNESDIINQLLEEKFITGEIAQILQQGIGDQVNVVQTNKNEMVAIILVIDKSGSMAKWQDIVIEGQKIMIRGWLGASAKYDIRFGQILFNHEVEYFQEISELRDQANPNRTHPSVMVLDKQNYQPGGFTALYDAILKGICSLTPIFYAMQNQGVALETKVCILTDGMDEGANGTGSKILPAQLGTAIRYMLDNNLINEISLAGIGDYDYRKIGKTIGINTVIEIPDIPIDSSLSQNERQTILDETERQIRRVFNIWSKPPGQL